MTPTEIQERMSVVRNEVASIALEGLAAPRETQMDAEAWARGEMTISEMKQNILKRSQNARKNLS